MFDIATGALLASKATSGRGFFGFAVAGEITAGGPPTVPDQGVALTGIATLAGLCGAQRRIARHRHGLGLVRAQVAAVVAREDDECVSVQAARLEMSEHAAGTLAVADASGARV